MGTLCQVYNRHYIHPSRARIVDVGEAKGSELTIFHQGKPVGNRSVTSVRLYFWNDGRLPIRKNDVLEQLRFELDGPAEILEAKIIKVSRKYIGFKIDIHKGYAKNILLISFDILEKSDGASIQIIYSGNPNANITLKGIIVGAGKPISLQSPRAERYYKRPDPKDTLKTRRRTAISIGVMGTIPLIIGLFLFLRARRANDEKGLRRAKVIFAACILLFVVYTTLGLYINYDINRTFSPGVPNKIWLD